MIDNYSPEVKFINWKEWFISLCSSGTIEANLDEITYERIYGIESLNNMIRDMILDD